jgi:hypothetical protein
MREKEARRAAREAKRRKAEESEEEEESPSNEITEQPTLERFITFLKKQQEFI